MSCARRCCLDGWVLVGRDVGDALWCCKSCCVLAEHSAGAECVTARAGGVRVCCVREAAWDGEVGAAAAAAVARLI